MRTPMALRKMLLLGEVVTLVKGQERAFVAGEET